MTQVLHRKADMLLLFMSQMQGTWNYVTLSSWNDIHMYMQTIYMYTPNSETWLNFDLRGC